MMNDGYNSATTPEVILLIDDVLGTLADTINSGEFPEIGYYGSSKKNVEWSENGYEPVNAVPSFVDGRKVESAKTIAGLVYGLTCFTEESILTL